MTLRVSWFVHRRDWMRTDRQYDEIKKDGKTTKDSFVFNLAAADPPPPPPPHHTDLVRQDALGSVPLCPSTSSNIVKTFQ